MNGVLLRTAGGENCTEIIQSLDSIAPPCMPKVKPSLNPNIQKQILLVTGTELLYFGK